MKGFLRTLILSCAASLMWSGGSYAMTDAQKQYACDRIMKALAEENTEEKISTGIAAESLEEIRELKRYFNLLYYGGCQPIDFFAKALEGNRYELWISAGEQAKEAVLEHNQASEKLRQLARELSGPDQEKTLDNIYRYVIGHVVYSGEMPASLYPALTEGRSTCAGYAALFERLCSLNHIPCAVVWGKDHAYNLVQVNGQVTVYDPTFDAAAGYGAFSGKPLAELAAWKENYYAPRVVEPSDFPVPFTEKGAYK